MFDVKEKFEELKDYITENTEQAIYAVYVAFMAGLSIWSIKWIRKFNRMFNNIQDIRDSVVR